MRSLASDLLFTDTAGDEVDVERWVPPETSFDIEVDHLVGGPERALLPQLSEETFEQLRERAIRRLPPSLGSVLRPVKSALSRATLIELIDDELLERVPSTAVREVDVPGDLVPTRYILEIHRRAALAGLAVDDEFVARLKAKANEMTRQAHLVGAYGGPPYAYPALPRCIMPTTSPWMAESWLGLSGSSIPEAMPDEVAGAIAQRFWSRYPRALGNRRPAARVLHWGALNSTLAVAFQATSPGLAVDIHEVDTVGQPQSISWVRSRTASIPEGVDYDLAVVHVPPPGEGGNHFRNGYKDLPGPRGDELHLEDIGRRGPRKWRRRLRSLIPEVASRLKPEGQLVLLLPEASRVAPRVSGFPQWGYERRPELLADLPSLLEGLGMSILVNVEVTEQNPLNQPHFVDRRCPWRFVLASSSPDAARSDVGKLDIDAILADLDVAVG